MKKYYLVYSYIFGNEYPTISQMFKTKKSAMIHFEKRVNSLCWDKVLLLEETVDNNNKPVNFEKVEVYTV